MDKHSSGLGRYGWFLLFIAGLGGLLYGIDVGIIAAALLYLGKTIKLSVAQTSFVVAAVLGGSMVASPGAGFLADWFGRKKMMIVSGLMFVTSIALIVLSLGFITLFLGRVLQGMSSGMIAVVAPLYLAECLDPKIRGRGTAVFQFMLTVGIVVAALVGMFYTGQAEDAIRAAAGNPHLIRSAEEHAWRGIFLTAIYPGIAFFLGAFGLSETPRWLFRHGRMQEAKAALRRSSSEEQARIEMKEMEILAAHNRQQAAYRASDRLLQRKYVFPFILACVILALTQTTGINSILAFLVIILKQAGMTPQHATEGDLVVMVINCVMTIVAVVLVDKKGRTFLLKWGTGGATIALAIGALLFYHIEARHVDVKAKLEAAERNNAITLPVNSPVLGPGAGGRPLEITVLYSYGRGSKLASVLSNDKDSVLRIRPDSHERYGVLVIKRALYGPVPSAKTGWWIAICLGAFIAFFAMGPGVVSWLVLSELMPMRIRSTGMGLSLFLNQGVATLIAAVFLPVVGNYGYSLMFLFWTVSTAIYFLVAVFFLPETKGKTLEEIEEYFETG